jgi:hypothetical protein
MERLELTGQLQIQYNGLQQANLLLRLLYTSVQIQRNGTEQKDKDETHRKCIAEIGHSVVQWRFKHILSSAQSIPFEQFMHTADTAHTLL